MQHTVIYQGEKFHLQSTKRYYQSGRRDAQVRSLHRRVWTDHNGPIPDGYEVHHKDNDWTNNVIDNLECLPMLVHQRQHMTERLADPEYKRSVLEYLKAAQEKAKEWHASPEGLAWHSAHGKATWVNRIAVPATCTVCNRTYETFRPEHSRFCSRSCEQSEGYQRNKTAKGACALCGSEFFYNKYRKQECCSKNCSNKLRATRERGLTPAAAVESDSTCKTIATENH
jgi:hypothetical protein